MSIEAINPNVRCDPGDSIKNANFRHIKDALSELSGSGSSSPWVRWHGSFTTDTFAASRISASDAGTFRFSTRIGPEDIGITHDPNEANPFVNGNFTVTESGLYLCVINFTAHYRSEGTPVAGDSSYAALDARYDRGSGFEAFPDNGAGALALVFNYTAPSLEVGILDAGQCASRTTLVPLVSGDVLRFTAAMAASFLDAQHTVRADVSFQRVADYSDEVSIYP
jgi:hypothetical protein